ncbi:hypothetical protein CapIbe_015789 [Capra ibex]
MTKSMPPLTYRGMAIIPEFLVPNSSFCEAQQREVKEAGESTTETKFFTVGRERFLHLHPIGGRTLLLKGHLSVWCP